MRTVSAYLIVLGVTSHSVAAAPEFGPACWEKPRGDTYDCICNANYCDALRLPTQLQSGTFHVYTSTPTGGRFALSFSPIEPAGLSDAIAAQSTVAFNTSDTRQEILGFGGALTDAAALNIANLSQEVRDAFFDSYFSENGLEYSFVRVPIGGTDFSDRLYTLEDGRGRDGELRVRLAPEDCDLKIPYLQDILKRRSDAKLVASSWKAPKWMTENGKAEGGHIKREYYDDWAEYHKRFFDLYKTNNLTFWGATTGNEVVLAVLSIKWEMKDHQDWVNNFLGPKLVDSGYDYLNLLLMDDQTPFLLQWMNLLSDETTSRFAAGMATHWYLDGNIFFLHKYYHKMYPNKLLISTEASLCKYEEYYREKTQWYGAELYAENILEKLSYYTNGWIDWNLALDPSGGPNYVDNTCEAAVVVHADSDEFHKRPIFYAMGHFSKFIPPGSRHVRTSVTPERRFLRAGAFAVRDRPWDVTVVVLNRAFQSSTVKVCVDGMTCAVIEAPPRAIISAIARLPSA